MKKDTRIYEVHLSTYPVLYYFMASDVRAIFEKKFDINIESIELITSIFDVYDDFYDNDGSCFLFHMHYNVVNDKVSERDTYVIAPSMNDAYKTIYNKEKSNDEKCNIVLMNASRIAPINYIKSKEEIEMEIELSRIG